MLENSDSQATHVHVPSAEIEEGPEISSNRDGAGAALSELEATRASSISVGTADADDEIAGKDEVGEMPRKKETKMWGKVRIAANVQANMAERVQEIRAETQRNVELRREAQRRMEIRNRMFEGGEDEYLEPEYLPQLNREVEGTARVTAAPTFLEDPRPAAADAAAARAKEQKIYRALRGKLPEVKKKEPPLAADAFNSVTLEVALEERAEIWRDKKGRIVKKYRGAGDEDAEEPEEGRALLGGSRRRLVARLLRPWKMLSREARWWLVSSWLYVALDFASVVLFTYLAFFLFRDDTKMDPLAWQLTFGATAIFTILHALYLVTRFIDFFSVYIFLVVLLVAGLFYGAVFYFLEIFNGEFSCFNDRSNQNYTFGICYEGRLLVGMMLAILCLILSSLYLWRWRIFQRLQRKQAGDYAESLNLDELMKQVDEKYDDVAKAAGSAGGGSMGVFDPGTAQSARSKQAKGSRQGFVGRILSLAPGVKPKTMSTTLRNAPHGRLRLDRSLAPSEVGIRGAGSGAPRTLGREAFAPPHIGGLDASQSETEDLQVAVRDQRLKNYEIQPHSSPDVRPPECVPESEIDIAGQLGARSPSKKFGEFLPSITPVMRTTWRTSISSDSQASSNAKPRVGRVLNKDK